MHARLTPCSALQVTAPCWPGDDWRAGAQPPRQRTPTERRAGPRAPTQTAHHERRASDADLVDAQIHLWGSVACLSNLAHRAGHGVLLTEEAVGLMG